MKCQNDGKYFHGSLERAAFAKAARCEASGWGANTTVALGLSLGSGILLPLSFLWWLQNVNAQSVCQVNILFGLMGPIVLPSSQVEAAYLQPVSTPCLGVELHFICIR